MNRFYQADDFRNIIKKFRREIPEITISTDVIAGFPTEDEKAFQKTLCLLEEIRPDVLNISRFWPRPGTKAAGMKQLHGRVTNQRSRRVAELLQKSRPRKTGHGLAGRALSSYLRKTNAETTAHETMHTSPSY